MFIYIIYIYAVMKTMCCPGYHNGSVANHALQQMMCGSSIVHHVPKYMNYHKAIVVITGRALVFMIAYKLHLFCFCEI